MIDFVVEVRKMKTINPLLFRSAEAISTSGRVRLDSQMKEVLPHEFKMTETKLVLSLSMSASLPLPLIQVPKRLARLGPELSPDSDPSTSLHLQSPLKKPINSKQGDIRFLSTAFFFPFILF